MDPVRERLSTVTEEERALGALDAFFAAASAGLALVDQELRYVRVNEALARISGRPVIDHLGRTPGEVLAEAELLEPHLRRVITTGAMVELPFEFADRAYTGQFFPVYGDGGPPVGVGAIVMDVTDQRRLERELRAAIEMRERVLAVVSHDLRNPLGTIELAVTTLDPTTLQHPALAKRIEIVQRATRTMEALIKDLLDTASIQAGKLSLKLREEHAATIVSEAIEAHAARAAEKGIRLTSHHALGDARVYGDRQRLLQVLGNLIGNAIKFCRPGDEVMVRANTTPRHVVFDVMDSGPGIAPSHLPHLFEAYWSTARGRETGTGLGLAISKAIVEAHGGSISVDSTLGKGTRFRIHIPRALRRGS